MTSKERVEAVLARRQADRPPFSFWHHFSADQAAGPKAVQAHLHLLETYGLDFLKVMNDNAYPRLHPIRTIDDLASVNELRGDEPEFDRQLDLIFALRRSTAENVLMTSTIFNAWAVLRQMVEPTHEDGHPTLDTAADAPSQWIRSAWQQSPSAVERALRAIGRSLARFASRCIDAGADGIFLSVRDDWVDTAPEDSLYHRLVRPTDLEILTAAAKGRFNMLHVCSKALDFRRFSNYPVHAINWADRTAGPSIAQVKDWLTPAICCGIDHLNTLPNGTPTDVASEVADAVKQAGERPIMIAPGCTFDPAQVPAENLLELARAVRESGR